MLLDDGHTGSGLEPRLEWGSKVKSRCLDRWTDRIDALRSLRARFAAMERYERASRAHLALQRAYERLANEIFSRVQH